MGNRAYVGPTDRQPVVISSKAVASALLPCTFVTEGASAFTPATAFGPNLRLLINRDVYSVGQFDSVDPLKTADVSRDTVSAAVLDPGQQYMRSAAAATYTFSPQLTLSVPGRTAGSAPRPGRRAGSTRSPGAGRATG